MYNKTSIKRNVLTVKKIHREVGRAKDLSVPRYVIFVIAELNCVKYVWCSITYSQSRYVWNYYLWFEVCRYVLYSISKQEILHM